MSAPSRVDDAVAWHDVECGGYGADLALWEELAAGAPGAVLELGCGTGRVALRLARAGHEVVGLDAEPELLAALRERAQEGGEVTTREGDARDFDLGERFGLVAAPMQLAQLLDEDGRAGMLASAAAHLLPGAKVAIAIASARTEPWHASRHSPAPAPDVREVDGWVYSSMPLGVEAEDGAIAVRRLRQRVAPRGTLDESEHVVRLFDVSPEELEREGRDHGLVPEARHDIPTTAEHIGSVVVVLEAAR